MSGDRDKFVWQPGDVEVRMCEACRRRPATDDQVPTLCTPCASTIDRDTDWLRELSELEHRP
jgi:hypothetical protein